MAAQRVAPHLPQDEAVVDVTGGGTDAFTLLSREVTAVLTDRRLLYVSALNPSKVWAAFPLSDIRHVEVVEKVFVANLDVIVGSQPSKLIRLSAARDKTSLIRFAYSLKAALQ